MSTVRANSITNSAGSGAPDFPNGLTSSTIPAANLTGTLPAIDGSALTNLPAPTTAQVGTATAGLAAGQVGSYAFLARGVTAAITAGTTYAGSDLRYAALYSGSFGGTTGAVQMSSAGSYVTGTWMALGSNGATNYPIAVFLRVA